MEATHVGRLGDLTAMFAIAVAAAIAVRVLVGIPGPALALTFAVLVAIAIPVGLGAPAGRQPNGIGIANRATLLRGMFVAAIAGLLPYPAFVAEHGWSLSAIALVVLMLDGADGWLARRYGAATRFGARFDMELDAAFILILCGLVWAQGKVGAWVLLIGLMRYAFVAAGLLLPRLRRPLPPSRRRKTVCVIQVGVLVLCLVPAVGPAFAVPAAAAALALLTVSFALDVRWLLRHCCSRTAAEDTA